MTPETHSLAVAHVSALWTPFFQMKSVWECEPIIFEHEDGSYLQPPV